MGTGYTRNDTPNNIADGNVINASDLDGEFDAIQAAFNASTGHSHDGTTGEGPQIGTGGIADNAVTLGTKTSGNYVATLATGAGLDGSASSEGATPTISLNLNELTTSVSDGDGDYFVVVDTLGAQKKLTKANIAVSGFNTANGIALGTDTTGNYIATGAVSGVGLSGSASAEGATFTVTSNATSANTGSTIVARDASGNFSAGQITGTAFVSTGDMTFGDNDKAIFGAGNDLQIYHDGTKSVIADVTGAGNFHIRGSNVLYIQSDDGGENYAVFNDNGSASLYYDNSKKIETTSGGIDVTGTVTADGLTVDTNTLYVDATNNRVGIGTSSPTASKLQVDGTDGTIARFRTTSGANNTVINITSSDAAGTAGFSVGGNASFPAMTFENGGSERMRISSAGAVSVGGTNTTARFNAIASNWPENAIGVYSANIAGQTNFAGIAFINQDTDSATGGVADIYTNPTGTLSLTSASNPAIQLKYGSAGISGGTAALTVDGSGNIGIGDASPDAKLDVYSTSGSTTDIGRFEAAVGGYTGTSLIAANTLGPASTYNLFKCISDSDGDAGGPYTEFVVRGDGNVGIGTAAPSGELHLYRNSTGPCRLLLQNTEDLSYIYSDGGQLIFDSDNGHLFRNEAGTTEFGRFDSSGNLLVGKTTTAFNTAGSVLKPSGEITATASGGAAAQFNRLTNDGTILNFARSGSTVGSIGAISGDIYIGTGDTTLRFYDAGNSITPRGTDGAANNGVIDLGGSSERFKNLYISSGIYAGSGFGTSGQVLTSNGTTSTWQDPAAGGAGYFLGENGATGDTTNGKGDIFRVHEDTLNTNVTIASSNNALCAGPLTIATGVTLTINGNLSIV